MKNLVVVMIIMMIGIALVIIGSNITTVAQEPDVHEVTVVYETIETENVITETVKTEEPYVSKEFLETLEANSRKNIYFGEEYGE